MKLLLGHIWNMFNNIEIATYKRQLQFKLVCLNVSLCNKSVLELLTKGVCIYMYIYLCVCACVFHKVGICKMTSIRKCKTKLKGSRKVSHNSRRKTRCSNYVFES